MKTSLLKVVLCKERLHWNRVIEIYGKFDNILSKMIAGTIVSLLFTVGHYFHVVMHVLYELVLYVFYRDAFKGNLIKLANTCNTK